MGLLVRQNPQSRGLYDGGTMYRFLQDLRRSKFSAFM
jgi:hypothetical protein